MCSVANKKEKLKNFAEVKMWYLHKQCNHDTLAPLMTKKHTIFNKLAEKFPHTEADGGVIPHTFDALSQECCNFEGNL
jgi:hypothetical protein